MKIIIAPDSFKGSNSAMKVANHIEKGVLKVFPDARIVKIPIADGGEGTVDAIIAGGGGEIFEKEVTGPLGEKVFAKYGILPDKTGIVEIAAASGLPLVGENKDPMKATTFGTGELIAACLDRGCKKIVVGLGGSATNDGGAGIAQALGVSLTDKEGKELSFGGGELSKLARIDITKLDPRLKGCEIIIACDVTNPLCGPKGASAVYGPQKGATEEQVGLLDSSLSHYAEVIEKHTGQQVADREGMGAAGGATVALSVFLNARICSGINTVLDVTGFDKLAQDADLVITGEGKIDSQSVFGKVPTGVGLRAKKYNIPVLAIVGDIGNGAEAVYHYGVDGIMTSVNRAMPLKEAIEHSGELLEDGAERVMRIIRIGMTMKQGE